MNTLLDPMPTELLAFTPLVLFAAILVGTLLLAIYVARAWTRVRTRNWITESRDRNIAWKRSGERRLRRVA